MNLPELQQKWNENAEAYSRKEVGGVQDFVKDCFSCPELFNLKNTIEAKKQPNTYAPEVKNSNGKVDFLIYVSKDVMIPCEVKHRGTISQGDSQIKRYQLDYSKQYGILTDGYEWRFYRANYYQVFTLDDIFTNTKEFLTFWKEYLKPENFYAEIFAPLGQQRLFEEILDLNDIANRLVFFQDTTNLIGKFKTKIQLAKSEAEQLETAYAYLIQFILYKILVDNNYQNYGADYANFMHRIKDIIRKPAHYSTVLEKMSGIARQISEYIYQPFAKEQKEVNNKVVMKSHGDVSIDDIAPWLDILIYIHKYQFTNLRNEIFGFIYENYLKDYYGDKNRGQYFTSPDIVNFMLDELGYTTETLRDNPDKISIIDPSCGAGTFLYSAVNRIMETFYTRNTATTAQNVHTIIENNIFGLDIAEFPLYLAEVNILMQTLPTIMNERFMQPIGNKLKLFKTRDSISEFLDTGITAQAAAVNLFSHIKEMALDYKSFMRDDKDLEAMLLSMQGNSDERLRFDYVVMNPPYVGYLECLRQKVEFTQKIKDKNNTSITMGRVFGVNLHSVPGHPKRYRPNPNLFAFFIAMGMALLKDNGKLAVIIPQTLLTAGDLDVLRYHLAKNVTIEKMITFDGNMFIGRGLKSNKTVPTSSLVLILQKKPVRSNHHVRITQFNFDTPQCDEEFQRLFKDRKKKTNSIVQSVLTEHWDNWNFIKHDQDFLQLYKKYVQHSESIDVYYNHQLALERFGSTFWFDGGYAIDESQTQSKIADYIYPKIHHRYYAARTAEGECKGYWKNIRSGNSPQRIGLTQGNQGYNLLDTQYKILWTYANTKRFYFTDKPVIWARNQYNAIGSNNRKEVLYLFALLNSPLNYSILLKQLKNPNEKGFLISRSSLKDYIRIPMITSKNKKLKEKIITKTEELLVLENVGLRNVVNFSDVRMQRMDSIKTEGDKLVLSYRDQSVRCKIKDGYEKIVHQLIVDKFYGDTNVSLSDLQELPAVDFDKQTEIKKEIDDLVFALYFDVPVKDVVKHEFYGYVNS